MGPERTDFIWISGIWREPPPNCQWTPGYWDQCDGGWRWTCGCWTPVDQGTCQYLPAPPPSVEQGPSSPPPTENCNCSWTPGYWSWHEATETGAARYVWSPGCWMTYNPDWLWVPPRYVSTACGCLFVQGYWDYPIERRGILYAPIYCAGHGSPTSSIARAFASPRPRSRRAFSCNRSASAIASATTSTPGTPQPGSTRGMHSTTRVMGAIRFTLTARQPTTVTRGGRERSMRSIATAARIPQLARRASTTSLHQLRAKRRLQASSRI